MSTSAATPFRSFVATHIFSVSLSSFSLYEIGPVGGGGPVHQIKIGFKVSARENTLFDKI